ncbi:MAG: hypothetical protein DRJ28_05145, partial [Actinobacteria bacterium]
MVPDIPTFAVDDGFSYLIPTDVTVRIGSRVKVRVSGRRVKGFVTALFEADEGRKLLPIDGLSGDVASFDHAMLDALRWASTHYVTPLSVMLKRTIPPNVPKHVTPPEGDVPGGPIVHSDDDSPVYRIGTPPFGGSVAATIEEVAGS